MMARGEGRVVVMDSLNGGGKGSKKVRAGAGEEPKAKGNARCDGNQATPRPRPRPSDASASAPNNFGERAARSERKAHPTAHRPH